MTLFINWRLGGLLISLVIIFYFVTSFVLRRTETLQDQVEHFNSSLAEHASDTLGNIPVVQSFTRIEHESKILKK